MILVTGCNGFIGLRVTQSLLSSGEKIIGLSLEAESKIRHENLIYYQIDICNKESLEGLFSKHEIDFVIHLAAIAHETGKKRCSWDTYYNVNYIGSKNLFECARGRKAKILYTSTVEVYGDNKNNLLNEDSQCEPVSYYGISKYMSEKELRDMEGVQYLILRLAPVYDREFMVDPYKRIYFNEPNIAFIVGNGDYRFHFCSIRNIVDLVLKWVNMKDFINGIYNFGDPQTIQAREFIEYEKMSGRAKSVIVVPIWIVTLLKFSVGKLKKSISVKINKVTNATRWDISRIVSLVGLPKWGLYNTVYSNVDIE